MMALRLCLVLWTTVALSCSGGGGLTEAEPPPEAPAPPAAPPSNPDPPSAPAPAPALSFLAIAGEWSGIVTERQRCCGEFQYRVTVTLADSAPRNAKVGDVEYTEGLECGGDWLATSASGDRYGVQERITRGNGCVSDVTIGLEHDPSEDLLHYRFGTPPNQGGTAVLSRVR